MLNVIKHTLPVPLGLSVIYYDELEDQGDYFLMQRMVFKTGGLVFSIVRYNNQSESMTLAIGEDLQIVNSFEEIQRVVDKCLSGYVEAA